MANLWGTLAAGGFGLTWFNIALGAAILWGLQYALWGQALKIIGPMAGLWWYCVISVVLYSCIMLVKGVSFELEKAVDWRLVCLMLLIGVLGFVANVGMLTGFKMANPTLVTMITASAPVFSAMFAYMLFRSVEVNWMTLVGFVLIMTGVGVVAWSKQV